MICFATTEWNVQVRKLVCYSLNLGKWARANDSDFQLQKPGQKCYAFRAMKCEFIYFHFDFFYVNLILYLYYQQKKYTYIYICPQEFKMVRNRRGIWKLYLRLLCSSKILIDWLHMCIFKRLALNITIISKSHPLKSRTIKAYASCIRSLNKEGFLSCHGGLLLGVAVALKGPPILTQTESLSKINKS